MKEGGGVHAVVCCMFRLISAVVEPTLEQLDGNDGEDELKQHVDDHNVEDILQWIDNAVKHRLYTLHDHGHISYCVQ